MLRRLLTNKKLLVIVPVVLALALTGLFLPVREVSIEPYGMLSLECKITISVGYEVAYASPDYEYKKPTAAADPSNLWNLEEQAYDGSPDDQTTAADSDPKPGNQDPWITYHTWDTKGQTYTATDLFVNWMTNGTYDDDQWGIKYTKDGGSTWLDLVVLGVHNDTAMVPSSVALDADQDLTQVQIKLVYQQVKGPDSAVTYIYDIWTRGTYTPPPVSNTPSSKDFNVVAANSSYWSNGSAPAFPLDDSECYFTVTNNSGGAVDINIKATSFTGGVGWTLTSGSPGENTVRMKAGKSGDINEDAMVILITSDQSFITGLADQASKKWEIKLETGTFTDSVQKSSTITLTAASS